MPEKKCQTSRRGGGTQNGLKELMELYTTEQLEAGIETWPRHIQKKRNIADLNVCNCGSVVSPNEANIIECKRVG